MKRYIFILFFLLLSLTIFSQKLNKIGRIVIDEIPHMPDYRVEKIDGVYKIFKDIYTFEGNTFFELPDGFISALIVVDDEKDYIKHYNKEGKLLKVIYTGRIINLKVSEKGNRAVFYNEDNIFSVNISTYEIDTLKASFIYEFVKGDKLIYYNKGNKSVIYDGKSIHIDEFPNQFIEYKGKILTISKHNIFELKPSGFESIYKFKGSFFDAKIINEEFYFVDKREKRKNESFSLYKTSDFSNTILVDRIDELNR